MSNAFPSMILNEPPPLCEDEEEDEEENDDYQHFTSSKLKLDIEQSPSNSPFKTPPRSKVKSVPLDGIAEDQTLSIGETNGKLTISFSDENLGENGEIPNSHQPSGKEENEGCASQNGQIETHDQPSPVDVKEGQTGQRENKSKEVKSKDAPIGSILLEVVDVAEPSDFQDHLTLSYSEEAIIEQTWPSPSLPNNNNYNDNYKDKDNCEISEILNSSGSDEFINSVQNQRPNILTLLNEEIPQNQSTNVNPETNPIPDEEDEFGEFEDFIKSDSTNDPKIQQFPINDQLTKIDQSAKIDEFTKNEEFSKSKEFSKSENFSNIEEFPKTEFPETEFAKNGEFAKTEESPKNGEFAKIGELTTNEEIDEFSQNDEFDDFQEYVENNEKPQDIQNREKLQEIQNQFKLQEIVNVEKPEEKVEVIDDDFDDDFGDFEAFQSPISSRTFPDSSPIEGPFVQQSSQVPSFSSMKTSYIGSDNFSSFDESTFGDFNSANFSSFPSAPPPNRIDPIRSENPGRISFQDDSFFDDFQKPSSGHLMKRFESMSEEKLTCLVKSVFIPITPEGNGSHGGGHGSHVGQDWDETDERKVDPIDKELERDFERKDNWSRVSDFEGSQALLFKWLNSSSHHQLLRSLNIDTTRIMYRGEWGVMEVPKFAASIVAEPLQPQASAFNESTKWEEEQIKTQSAPLEESEGGLSGEAKEILNRLPDLSFMQAKTLVFQNQPKGKESQV